jgi:hypothetical protein
MAAVAKAGLPSLASTQTTGTDKITGLLAGEALGAFDACYVSATDGRVYRSTGAAANAAAVVDGFAASPTPVGEAVTLWFHVHVRYGASLTPGTSYYLSGTVPGGLDTVVSTGGTQVIARAVDGTRVWIKKSY